MEEKEDSEITGGNITFDQGIVHLAGKIEANTQSVAESLTGYHNAFNADNEIARISAARLSTQIKGL